MTDSSFFKNFQSNFVTGTGAAYAQNDVLGARISVPLFENKNQVWRFAGGKLSDLDNTAAFHYSIMFFNEPVTMAADNAAFTISAADAASFLGHTGSPASTANTISAGGFNRLYVMPYGPGSTQGPTGPIHVQAGRTDLNLYMVFLCVNTTNPVERVAEDSMHLYTSWELVSM